MDLNEQVKPRVSDIEDSLGSAAKEEPMCPGADARRSREPCALKELNSGGNRSCAQCLRIINAMDLCDAWGLAQEPKRPGPQVKSEAELAGLWKRAGTPQESELWNASSSGVPRRGAEEVPIHNCGTDDGAGSKVSVPLFEEFEDVGDVSHGGSSAAPHLAESVANGDCGKGVNGKAPFLRDDFVRAPTGLFSNDYLRKGPNGWRSSLGEDFLEDSIDLSSAPFGINDSNKGEQTKPCAPDIEDVFGSICPGTDVRQSLAHCVLMSLPREGNHSCTKCSRIISGIRSPEKRYNWPNFSSKGDKNRTPEWPGPQFNKALDFTEAELAGLWKETNTPHVSEAWSASSTRGPHRDKEKGRVQNGGAGAGSKASAPPIECVGGLGDIEDWPFPDIYGSPCTRLHWGDWKHCALRNAFGQGNNPCGKCERVISVVGRLQWRHVPLRLGDPGYGADNSEGSNAEDWRPWKYAGDRTLPKKRADELNWCHQEDRRKLEEDRKKCFVRSCAGEGNNMCYRCKRVINVRDGPAWTFGSFGRKKGA